MMLNIVSGQLWSLITVSLVMIITLNPVVDAFAAVNRRFCQSNADCGSNQCCTDTPIGYKLCLNYEKEGDLCFFRHRTPTCGCASGLRCVSTMPMEPGLWNHDYVCAKVRPFMHFKLLPFLEDSNELDF